MNNIDSKLAKVLSGFCAVLMFVMMTLTFAQVICRYILGNALSWSEEAGRYIFVWMTFIGMAVAMYRKAHVALDILLHHLHDKAKKALLVFNDFLIILFSSVVVYSGSLLYNIGTRQRSSAMDISMNVVYIVVPASGLALLYFAIVKLLEDLKKTDDKKSD